ncbi:N-acyl homoserine lactonase family protein [Xanthomonas sp. NCPPB 3005]|uniref:N-acyl homoserine lactonase family protein n=1 Tax=Xanthomonas sp. NCPPB 3005 TaxID=3240913 RepID=UPI0035192531
MKIHCIQTGDVQIKAAHQRAHGNVRPRRVASVLLDRQWSPRLPIGCTLIEHPEGLIMVDTGESSHANDPGYQPWWHPFMRFCERRWVEPEEEVGPRLQALGFAPSDVRWVVMTHMHGDHAGGLHHFPHSDIVMSAVEADASLAATGPLSGYLNMHYPAWLLPRTVEFDDGPWENFERSSCLTRDGRVRLLPTPGHTRGHLCVAVDLKTHVVLVAGDAAYSEQALLDGVVDGVAQDAAQHRQSTARLRELCRRRPVVTLFAHDADSQSRLRNGVVTIVP